MTVIATSGVFIAFMLFTAFKVFRARRKPPIHGEGIGEVAEAIDDITKDSEGFVSWRGEIWKAKPLEDIKKGDKVIITGKEGPSFLVKKQEK